MLVVFYLELHQPWRLRLKKPGPVRSEEDLVDREADRRVFLEAAQSCYRPLVALLERGSELGLKAGVKITGTLLEQMRAWDDSLIDGFKELARRGVVELVAGPYHQTLSFLLSPSHYMREVEAHVEAVDALLGFRPRTLANPYLAYNNAVGEWASALGFRAAIAEGVPGILGWRTPNLVYRHPTSGLRILLRNPALSNEIAFRLPHLDAASFAGRVARSDGEVVTIGVAGETFGVFFPGGEGSPEFLARLAAHLREFPWVSLATPGEAVEKYEAVDHYSSPETTSWLEGGDTRSLTGSPLQRALLELLRSAAGAVEPGSAGERILMLLSQSHHLQEVRDSPEYLRVLVEAFCLLRCSGLGGPPKQSP